PAVRSQYVISPVAIDISSSNAVTITPGADNMFRNAAMVIPFKPGERGVRVTELGKNLLLFAVIVEVDEELKLDGRTGSDYVFLPDSLGRTGILPPGDLLAEPTDGD